MSPLPAVPTVDLPSRYQHFIFISRYARWLEEEKRRETWNETVARYFDFFAEYLKEKKGFRLSKQDRIELETAVLNLEVMPSMRALMTAGPALERTHVAGFNCAFLSIDKLRCFDEIMYILLCGTGVGFSVEREFTNKLPTVSETMSDSETVIVVEDSKEGWVKAFRELLSLLVSGQIPKWDMSNVRKAGSRLKTFGGRASGPEPLDRLFKFCVRMFRRASGRKLTSLECHDICCMIGDVVVVGGVRRSAMISLSDLNDLEMRDAKSGNWYDDDAKKQRRLANNSAVYECKPSMELFMEEWLSLVRSKSGERGIFNRQAARAMSSRNGRRDGSLVVGCNPCSEIFLRSNQFCNLTEAVARAKDTFEILARKVRFAAILGTWQSCLTEFPILRTVWKKNCEEEALLGVSITGIMDCEMLRDPYDPELPGRLENLRQVVIDTNKEWAAKLGIAQSTAATCVKPSGTVSELVDSSSGMHRRHAKYSIRRVRADVKDPLCRLMIDAGFPNEPCVSRPDTTVVFSFPKQCVGAYTRDKFSAVEHLDLWLVYQRHWCEHKPSVTISVREKEWMDVGAWVYRNFDEATGISFLPYEDDDHIYQQAPLESITEERYLELAGDYDKIVVDWNDLGKYEMEDNTVGAQTLACTGTSCTVVDLISSHG